MKHFSPVGCVQSESCLVSNTRLLDHRTCGVFEHRNRFSITLIFVCPSTIRCGNVAAILELDEHLQREFIIFEAAPQETRGIPSKKPVADYFLWSLWANSHDVSKSPVPFFTQPPSILLLDGSVSLNLEQLDRKPARTCEAARGFSLKSWIFATLPKSDRAVTVKGVGDEVDTGAMTVVTSPQL